MSETVTLTEVREFIAALKATIADLEEEKAFWVNVESIVVCADEPEPTPEVES